MSFTVSRYGKTLDPNFYTWDKENKIFTTKEDNVVLDFSTIDGVTFNTGSFCTIEAGSNCIFNIGDDCNVISGSGCNVVSGSGCMINTCSGCTFDVKDECVFKTGSSCEFKVGIECVIIRRDNFEVIHPDEKKILKLNKFWETGFTYTDKNAS